MTHLVLDVFGMVFSRNEDAGKRRMLGLERAYGRPVVEKPYGARILLYSDCLIYRGPCGQFNSIK